MRQKPTKRNGKEVKKLGRDDTARLTADFHGVTANYVRKIVRGTRNNPDILNTYRKISRQRAAMLNKLSNGRAAKRNTKLPHKHGR